MAEKPLPRNVSLHRRPHGSGDKDKLVEEPLLLTMCWLERKKTPQHLKLCDYESPSSPNNNQQGTRTKQKETWTPNPVKCCWSVYSTSPDGVSLPAAAAAPSTAVAGTHGGTWPPPQQKMTGRCLGQPRLHTFPLHLSIAGELEWLYGAGACSVFPTVVPWLAIPGDSNEKGRKKGQKRRSALVQTKTKEELLPSTASASQ